MNTRRVKNISDIPQEWVYRNYYPEPITQSFTGATITLKSPFKTERTPSFKIWFGDNIYFKCWSTGKSGNHINFVQELFNIDYVNAIVKIENDYLHGKSFKLSETYTPLRWSLSEIMYREINDLDLSFWHPYGITKEILNIFNVKPCSYILLNREDEVYKRSQPRMYAYHNKVGEPIKIYLPGSKKKFVEIKNYIQGLDQCKGHKCLVIMSSLKDIMSAYSFNLNVDYIAPQSENSYLPIDYIKEIKERYKYIFVLFDNDEAGIKSMKKYREEYGFKPILLNFKKDLSDSVKAFGKSIIGADLIRKLHDTSGMEDTEFYT